MVLRDSSGFRATETRRSCLTSGRELSSCTAIDTGVEPRPPDSRGGRSRRAHARDERPARAHGPRTQPALGQAKLGVPGSVSRAAAADFSRGARRARLRVAERPTSRATDARHRPLLVGALVRRLESGSRRSRALPGCEGENLAPAGRVETSRIDRARGISATGVALRRGSSGGGSSRSLPVRIRRNGPSTTTVRSGRTSRGNAAQSGTCWPADQVPRFSVQVTSRAAATRAACVRPNPARLRAPSVRHPRRREPPRSEAFCAIPRGIQV
jgi:hypothetical protein